MQKVCENCGKVYDGIEQSKYCSLDCHTAFIAKIKNKQICRWCKKSIEGQNKMFCSKSCATKYQHKYNPKFKRQFTEEQKKEQAERMRKLWDKPGFREDNHKRMTENNPVYQNGVVEKAMKTRLSHDGYANYFKYGNGKISVYEQIANETLQDLGFTYNTPINTSVMRNKYPERHYPTNYKPDFLHKEKKICIEIDGNNHKKPKQKALDEKKDECLSELGYTIIRFTHEDIDSGKLGEFVKQWQN